MHLSTWSEVRLDFPPFFRRAPRVKWRVTNPSHLASSLLPPHSHYCVKDKKSLQQEDLAHIFGNSCSRFFFRATDQKGENVEKPFLSRRVGRVADAISPRLKQAIVQFSLSLVSTKAHLSLRRRCRICAWALIRPLIQKLAYHRAEARMGFNTFHFFIPGVVSGWKNE